MADQITYDFVPAVSGDWFNNDETFIIPDNYDLTGASIVMRILKQDDTNAVVQELTNINHGILIIDRSSYTTNFGIVNLKSGIYTYTIRITFLTGYPKTWVKGLFVVSK